MSQISPIILQTRITVPAGGSMGVADPTKLENPFQGPMWLEEIRFRLPTLAAGPGVGWSSLRVELKLGDIPITNGYVPISLLGKVLNEGSFGNTTINTNAAVTNEIWLQSYTWKLPKPLYIPAREYLKPQMYFDPYPGAAPIDVVITYSCRPIPAGTPPPAKIRLPWVAFYQPPYIAVPTNGSDVFNTSAPSDLYNPFQQDLHVERFLGRFMVQGGYALPGLGFSDGEDGYAFGDLNSARVDLTTTLPTQGTFVSGQDSFNNILIRDPTPFAHVFDFLDRAWTVHATLPPQGYYLFKIDRMWGNYNPTTISPTPAPGFSATVGISMVAWREVPYLPPPGLPMRQSGQTPSSIP